MESKSSNLRKQSIRSILKNAAPSEADIAYKESLQTQKYSKNNPLNIIKRPNFKLDVRMKLGGIIGKEFTMGNKYKFVGTCIYNSDSPKDPVDAMDEFKNIDESIAYVNSKYKGKICTLLNIGDVMNDNHEPTGDVILKVEFKDTCILFCNVFELEDPFSKIDTICQICEMKRLKICNGCF